VSSHLTAELPSAVDALSAAVLARVVRVLAGSSVRWVGCRPDETRQRIYFANHTSHLDAVVLWAALRPAARAVTRPVAARDYWTADRLRQHLATRVLRAVLIDRHHVSAHEHNPLTPLLEALEGGRHSLILFPEGTRGTAAEPGPFKSGLYHLARQRPDVELIPVLLDNMNRILPKGELLPVPLLGGLSFGAALRLEPDEGKREFLTRARAAVCDLRNV
jgi:1-acyl-sn-glycerol-3-phosphate acyltransferase